MNGLELSESYYKEIVEPGIREICPEALLHLAAGLAGEGSECFGYDDEISRDHDFGPRVCLWLTDENEKKYGDILREILTSLPGTFRGIPMSIQTEEARDRSGVIIIQNFYRKFTGRGDGPEDWRDWIRLPQEHLAACTNGKVFYDAEGIFSGIRSRILRYYPEDVRRKKIAAKAACMAQSGQYNYMRCIRRGERTAAFLALSEFLKNTIEMIYLLNKKYMPYYKWSHRGTR